MALYLVYFQFNNEYIDEFTLIGTYEDYAERILGTSDKAVFKNNTVTYAEECNELAIKRRHPYFGIEHQECHTGFLTKSGDRIYHPLKNTDYYGNRNPNNKTRSAVNESRDFTDGGPGTPYEEPVQRSRIEKREKPKPKPDYRYLAMGPFWGAGVMASKLAADMARWSRDKYEYITVYYTEIVKTDRQHTLVPANAERKIPISQTDPTPTDAGGGWKMSIYEADKAKTNSSSAPTALNQDTKFDYFTTREGFDPEMDSINRKYGFKVNNMNEFVPYLIDNINLVTKVFTIPIQVPPTFDYKFKGYYMDGPDRTISDNVIGRSNWQKCKEEASKQNYKYFAMQYGEACFMGNRMSKEIRLDNNNPNIIPNELTIQDNGKPIRTNCMANPINTYGNKFGGAWCNAVWEKDTTPTTKNEYTITIADYEGFIKTLKGMNIDDEDKFREITRIEKFTTIKEGAATITNVNKNISLEAKKYGINLPMYEDISHLNDRKELVDMFQSISQYGVKDGKLPEWTRFKEELKRIGNTVGATDTTIVNALRKFGYPSFDKIDVDRFAEPYLEFRLDSGRAETKFDILDVFTKFLKIGVNANSFAHFTGRYGIKQFETPDYPVNAITFFGPGKNGEPSLYYLFTSINFYYNRETFPSFVKQVQTVGEIRGETQISATSSQQELQDYVLHLSVNTNISIVKKFQIFIDTLKSIGIKNYDTYQWFIKTIDWLGIKITNIQIFILKYRYYYIFLSDGMPWAYSRKPERQVPDFVSKELPVDDYLKPWYWYVILVFIYYVKRIQKFNVTPNTDFDLFMDKVVEYGWSFDTLVTDAKIGNTFEKTTRQGFSPMFDSVFNSVTELFSSIAETFMGIQESFKELDVTDENDSMNKFGAIPVNRNNAELLALFNNYNIFGWDTIMQYIIRMNRIMIPFRMGPPGLGQLPPLANPTPDSNASSMVDSSGAFNQLNMLGDSAAGPNMLDIPNATTTLELFETFGVNFSRDNGGKDGLDLFDHLLDVVKVPTAMEIFRFLNKLIEFKVDYSTYYDFMKFFDETHMNLQYFGMNPNHEIFYMFIDDLIELSNNGMVPFDYKTGRSNFETLVNNYESDIFLHCVNKPKPTATPQISAPPTSTTLIFSGRRLSLHDYRDVLRNLLYIFYNFDKMVLNDRFNCHDKICNRLIDWTTPRTKGDATSAYQNVLQPYIDINGDQKPDLDIKGGSSKELLTIFVNSGIVNVFNYLSDAVPPLHDPNPIPMIPCNLLKGVHPGFNMSFCISALTSEEYKQMKNCQYNFTSKEKLNRINTIIYTMIKKNTGTFNNETTRSQSTIETYNKNIQTINFLILYPMFSFEIISAAISNPCESASMCPSLPGENYDSISDPTNQYNMANNRQASSNIQRPDILPAVPASFAPA